MLTVAILINGQPIMARSAVNTGKTLGDGCVVYEVDDGSKIHHRPGCGAVKLAEKLLKTIREQKASDAISPTNVPHPCEDTVATNGGMMKDELLKCPECGSDKVTVSHLQRFMANTGEHYCHSVKTQDDNSEATCLDCEWRGRRDALVHNAQGKQPATTNPTKDENNG